MTVIKLGIPSTTNNDVHLDLWLLTFVLMNTVHQLKTGALMQVLVYCRYSLLQKIYIIIFLFHFVKCLIKCFYILLKSPFKNVNKSLFQKIKLFLPEFIVKILNFQDFDI